MLKKGEACARFQARFELGRDDAHRAGCPACDAFARRLEELLPRKAPAELPAALREKLLAIPGAPAGCPGEESLYRAALVLARGGGGADPAAREVLAHLGSCRGCSEVAASLAAAFETGREALPGSLAARLAAIPGRLAPAWTAWLADFRLAVVASYLLTVGLMLAAGDSQALLRGASQVRFESAELVRAGQQRAGTALGSLRSLLGRGEEELTSFLEGVAAGGRRIMEILVPDEGMELARELYERLRETLDELEDDNPGSEGDEHGTRDRDADGEPERGGERGRP